MGSPRGSKIKDSTTSCDGVSHMALPLLRSIGLGCVALLLVGSLLVMILLWVFDAESVVEADIRHVALASSLPSHVLRGDAAYEEVSPEIIERRSGDISGVLPWRPRYPWRGFFIALNLFNNAAVLPQLAENLALFIRNELEPFFDVSERVFISIFSNGSEDSTEADIESILVPILVRAGIPRRRMDVVVGGSCCGGFTKRPKTMDRIEWMACVRNAAMHPLYREGLQLFSLDRMPSATTSTHSSREPSPPDSPHTDSHAQATPPPGASTLRLKDGTTLASTDVAVLFFNDILFDRFDVTALLESNYARTTRWTRESGAPVGPAVPAGMSEVEYSKLWDGFDMACGMDFYTTFYDQWVTRGADGRQFDPWPPYAKDIRTQEVFAAASRIGPVGSQHHRHHVHVATPVRCCWNGLAIIRASMFLEHGIRFRRPESTMFNMSRDASTCYSSECMLICQDIAAVGSRAEAVSRESSAASRKISSAVSSIVLNPHVKVAYDKESFALHRRHWFVSSRWYFSLISWLRVSTWLLPDGFQPPTKRDPAEDRWVIDPLWVECVLPQDTLPPYRIGAVLLVALAGVVLYCTVWPRVKRWRQLRRGAATARRVCDGGTGCDEQGCDVSIVVGSPSASNVSRLTFRSSSVRDLPPPIV